MNFMNFFHKKISNGSVVSMSDIDECIEKFDNGELNISEQIEYVVIDLTVGFNEDMVFSVSESTPIDFFNNEPVCAGFNALKQAIDSLSMVHMINYGLIRYKNNTFMPNKQIQVSFIYSQIPNIVPYSSIINNILLRNYDTYDVEESIDQLDHLANYLSIVSYDSPTSIFINHGGVINKKTSIINSQWNIITDTVMDDSLSIQIIGVLNNLCK